MDEKVKLALVKEIEELERKIAAGEYIEVSGQVSMDTEDSVSVDGKNLAQLMAHLNLTWVKVTIERIEDGPEIYGG